MRTGAKRLFRWTSIGLFLLLVAGTGIASAVQCAASGSWVKTPSLPDFQKDPTDPCGFYQYAWQAFLYLTSEQPGAGGSLVFENYPQIETVVGPGSLAGSNESLLGPPRLSTDPRNHRLRRFEVRGSEPFSHEQAGSKGILIDQNGNVVYYDQYLDPIAYNFVQSCSLNLATCRNVKAAQTLRFPAGSLEIKASWKVMPHGTDLTRYYTLPLMEVYNPKTKRNEKVTLGLVGFHLVYSTPHHPEMTWATFEHWDNAPDRPCTVPTRFPPVFSGWAFNNASAACDEKTINHWDKDHPYEITQAFRNYRFGSDASPAGKENAETLAFLHQSVNAFLPPLWKNYFLVGGIWTDKGALPPIPPSPTSPGNEIGSTFLANASMETFTQPAPPPIGDQAVKNCFFCHTPGADAPPFLVSHAVGKLGGVLCPYDDKLPAACQATQMGEVQTVAAHKPARKK